ncbi:helix-turn-helix domain-containing protein [Pedobacter deserti]|uniref:helix-turn-helix domain-containing protein n=1 Tax=Pedobacter deserti TaxID=2817382 RepID=UPI00210A4E18|nr:helix-turn-helix transcriptional regulator [Pedobacter sp. SYSU D00382]
MSTITGIDKLAGQVSAEQLSKLNKAAERHERESSITFSIKYTDEHVTEIECRQQENRSGNYATEATLIKRTRELFSKFLPQSELVILPVTFRPSPASEVTPAWLDQKMNEKGIRIKQIAFDTGVDRESISDWVTGKRNMSQIVKAMFYYYFAR